MPHKTAITDTGKEIDPDDDATIITHSDTIEIRYNDTHIEYCNVIYGND